MAFVMNVGYEYRVEVKATITNIVRGNTDDDIDLTLLEMDRVIAGIEGIKEVHEGNWKVEEGIATAEYKVVIEVTAHDEDEAFENAQGQFESRELPEGMKLIDATPIDYEWYNDTQYAIVGD